MSILDNILGKKKGSSDGIFDKFISKFKPSDELRKPTQDMLDWYEDKLPKSLLEFWKNYGFGNYANGMIKVIEPSDYMDNLYSWLGIEEDFSRLPILVTGFGDIYYYRKLTEDEDDVSLLNIHYRDISVCTYSFEDFFTDYIIDEDIYKEDLKKDLFEKSLKAKGKLTYDEIFFFVPALILGGSEKVENIDKGDANIHQDILLQMG